MARLTNKEIYQAYELATQSKIHPTQYAKVRALGRAILAAQKKKDGLTQAQDWNVCNDGGAHEIVDLQQNYFVFCEKCRVSFPKKA